MLRTKPISPYNGLTVVLSNPSRADNVRLLSAGGGRLFTESIGPELSFFGCDIRVKEDTSPLLDGTKCVLLCGEDAAKQWLQNTDNTINEIRGSVYVRKGVPFIPTYFPQDCADVKDYEGEHNERVKRAADGGNTIYVDTRDDEEGSALEDKSRHGKTKRKNFRFWFQQDIKRAKKLISLGGKVPEEKKAAYHIYPSAETVVNVLTNTKQQPFYFDCETDENLNITCFAFSFGLPDIYVVPCIDHNYNWAYSSLPQILRALAICVNDNTIIAHNGAAFDFFVLAHKYRIAIGRSCYDTMLAHHRCFPDVEKSLGHCMSIWTWQPFHKDENSGWWNKECCQKTMEYCGKDVYGMILLHESINSYAKMRPGLQESIDQANASIRPYLIATLMGIKVIPERRQDMFNENDALMEQYNRIIYMLIGPVATAELRKRSKKSMAGSSQQCARYFHEMLGYDVMHTSKKTGEPSLGKKQMYQLALKYNNPVIPVVMAYRELAKESGSLKWTPWKE